MKQNHFTNRRNRPFFSVLIIYCVLLAGHVSSSDLEGSNSFLKRYREYRGHVRPGYTAMNKKDYEEAIDHYTKAIELSPFVASHYYQRGLAWYRKGNKDKALEDFDKAIILDSRWSSAYIYRGLCEVKKGAYAKALSDYKRALQLNPKDPTVHNNLAWLYATPHDEKFRDKAKALEHVKKEAELSKEKDAEILDTLAKAYFINGKLKEAVEAERKALNLARDNEGFRENLEVNEEASKE